MSETELKTVLHRLFEPLDIAILVYFRIIFGVLMLWSVISVFNYNLIARHWIEPAFYFPYYGFDWIRPWPGDGMYIHFVLLGILSVCIILGFKYRITTALFFVGYAYVFLLDQTLWSHYEYLIVLTSFLMIFVPAHRAFSIDAWKNPKIKSDYAPAWSLWILRFQIGAVYFFSGVAKLNSDWLNGEPLRIWLAERAHFPFIGEFFTEEWLVLLFTYSALFIDLLAVPFLLWRRTGIFAFGFLAAFHVLNSHMFLIDIFPWFMIFATALFFDPSWPRSFNRKFSKKSNKSYLKPITHSLTKNQKVVLAFLLIFVIIQISLPLRHFFYPGSVHWNGEGEMFEWHMRIKAKYAEEIVFYATNPITGKTWEVDPLDDLNYVQLRDMGPHPDNILQYSHYLADRLNQEEGYDDIEIRVKAMVSLNGREPQLMIDPTINLVEQPQTLLHKTWILPAPEKLNMFN